MLRRYVTLSRFHITRVTSYSRKFAQNLFQSIDIFFRQIMSYMWCKKMGVTEFVSEIKKLVRVIQHGLLGFILKHIEY